MGVGGPIKNGSSLSTSVNVLYPDFWACCLFRVDDLSSGLRSKVDGVVNGELWTLGPAMDSFSRWVFRLLLDCASLLRPTASATSFPVHGEFPAMPLSGNTTLEIPNNDLCLLVSKFTITGVMLYFWLARKFERGYSRRLWTLFLAA